jgi:hypothetical protein
MSEVAVLPESIDIEVTSGGNTVAEEIFIDTAPKVPSDLADRTKTPVVQSRETDRSKLVIGIVAAVVALVAVLVVTRKRR